MVNRSQQILIILILIVISMGSTISLYAQRKTENGIYYGFRLLPGYSSYTILPNPPDFTSYASKRTSEINFGLTGQYFFNATFGFETGLTLLTHQLKASGVTYTTSYQTTDTENVPYERIITGNNISESTILRTLNIPLNMVYHYPLSRKFNFFASGGPGFAFAVQNKVHGQGTFTYKGYYPSTHATIENIPAYGFNSNVPVDVTEKMPVKPMIIFVSASTGFTYTINEQYNIYLGANYYNTITPITKSSGASYHVTDELNSFNSFMTNLKKPVDVISIMIGVNIKLEFDE